MAEYAEYIERDALIKRLCERCNEEMSESPCEPSDCFVREVIKTIPAADVAPVRHGKWRYYHKQNISVCTECSFEQNLDANFGRAVSCPNCGAKMDG